MKKYLLIILLVVSSVSLFGQSFSIGLLTYTVVDATNKYVEVKKKQNDFNNSNVQTLVIPATVTNNNVTYTVTRIADNGFQQSNALQTAKLPNTITSIGNNAFDGCGVLKSINLPNSITSMGTAVFKQCHDLISVVLPEGITSIPNNTFENCSDLLEIVIPAGVTSIGEYAFQNCNNSNITIIFMGGGNVTIPSNTFQNCNNVNIVCVSLNPPITFNGTNANGQSNVAIFGNNAKVEVPCENTGVYYVSTNNGTQIDTQGCGSTTRQSGLFSDPTTWEGYETWSLKNTYEAASNKTSWLATNGYPAFMPREVKRPFCIKQGHTVTLNHRLEVYPYTTINEGVLKIDVPSGGQLVNIADANTLGEIEIVSQSANTGNWNFFGVPFEDYKLEVIEPHPTSDVAVCKYDYNTGAWSIYWATPDTIMEKGEGAFAYHFYTGSMVFTSKIEGVNYKLNNGDITVTHSIISTSNGNWMALANPYPAKLDISKFKANQGIQGNGVYIWNGTSFDLKESGNINVTEGFFVNFSTSGTYGINFKKNQILNYPTTAKSEVAERELIELALEKGGESVKVYFTQNEDAEQEYDIYDANKMFATVGVAEPYFLTEGIALVKEEVKELPYYAIMNVRSEENAEMNFVMKKLPQGYSVSLIDGEETIEMAEGSSYSTQITIGDNENRFKLLVKKNVGLSQLEEIEARIINRNREISILSAEKDLKIEVYNALGQKVFETKNYNFTLKGVSSGAYLIKAYNNTSSKTSKVIIR